MDLLAERYEVRNAAQRNLYTGKTYNSVENIRQFFAEKGMPAPQGLGAQPKQAAQQPAAATPVRSAPAPRKKLGPGATIEHAK